MLLIPSHLSSPSISLAEGEAPESGNKDSCGTGNHVSSGFLLLWVVGVFRDPQTMAIPEEEAHFFGSVALGVEVSFCFPDCRKLP